MNPWKPLCLINAAMLVAVLGHPAAHARAAAPRPGAQPHMDTALAALRSAREELEHAEHDKGGWRDAAIRDTQAAIDDTLRGMSYSPR